MPQIVVKGPTGRLEAFYHHSPVKNSPIALILHSNPQLGGTMHDKPVYVIYKAFADLGFSVMRFNFRGVGRSEGESKATEIELEDASACLNWLCAHNPDPAHCFVGGYSFGAYIGMQLLMRRPEVKRFISVAPPINLYDFSFLAPCPAPGLVLQGSNDMMVPREAVTRFVNRLNAQPSMNIQMKVLRHAEHDFAGNLVDLFDATQEYVKKEMERKKKEG